MQGLYKRFFSSMSKSLTVHESKKTKQFTSFLLGENLYGIDVMRVQEVTNALEITRVPLAPQFIHGLINLRGQISTAISLRVLFEMEDLRSELQMNVVVRIEDFLFSFLVDSTGDVIEVLEQDFEETPETIPDKISYFISGVYKIKNDLISIIDVNKLTQWIALNSKKND